LFYGTYTVIRLFSFILKSKIDFLSTSKNCFRIFPLILFFFLFGDAAIMKLHKRKKWKTKKLLPNCMVMCVGFIRVMRRSRLTGTDLIAKGLKQLRMHQTAKL